MRPQDANLVLFLVVDRHQTLDLVKPTLLGIITSLFTMVTYNLFRVYDNYNLHGPKIEDAFKLFL